MPNNNPPYDWYTHFNELLSRRPVAVALAGPNGAGKSTLYELVLRPVGLPFVNADVIAKEQGWTQSEQGSQAAADRATATRAELLSNRLSFVYETVFSDPVGEKLQQMLSLEAAGYAFILVFVGLASSNLSQARVIARVEDGGHDVPDDRIFARYGRSLQNLRAAFSNLSEVIVLDNSDDQAPYRCIAVQTGGQLTFVQDPLPLWAQAYIHDKKS